MLVIVIFAGACQIGQDELFMVVNDTEETVVVKWNEQVYATLPPGRSTGNALPGDCPASPQQVDRLTATSTSGKGYQYRGRVCNGNAWHVTSPSE
jgi:hypothetical protein